MNAATILEDLARRGVTVMAKGDKLRIAPASAISPELHSVLLEHKAELLATLSAPPPDDALFPWPATLAGLGEKRLGGFALCVWCGRSGTWVRYVELPTCLSCARSWPNSRTPDEAKAYLSRLLDTWATMNESEWDTDSVDRLKD